MRLLLDTHVWLWMVSDQAKVSVDAKRVFTDEATDLFLSAAAVWEIGIKHGTGKLKLTGRPSVLIPQYVARSGVQPLAVTVDHALTATELPMHHRDPFDRIMVAQARHEELTLVTADRRLAAYDVAVMDPTA